MFIACPSDGSIGAKNLKQKARKQPSMSWDEMEWKERRFLNVSCMIRSSGQKADVGTPLQDNGLVIATPLEVTPY